MIIAHTKKDLARAISELRDSGKSVGFVPTMGALHAGHISLVHLAQERADCIVVSIFVNPTQFAPHEDFDSYPRTEDTDIEKLKAEGVDIIFLPQRTDIYPDGTESDIKAGAAAKGLESDFRPHFFDGVVNVVHRLFDAVKPDIAVFGEKDFQQLMVIRDMVETRDLPIKIIGAPIARDNHGLALSSRNAYLSDDERKTARQLNIILQDAAGSFPVQGSTRIKATLLAMTKGRLLEAGFDKVDYVEEREGRILAAAWIGKTRLIDNMPLK